MLSAFPMKFRMNYWIWVLLPFASKFHIPLREWIFNHSSYQNEDEKQIKCWGWDEAAFSKHSTANFYASASIALTQRLRLGLPLELYSDKSLLMCFLYLLKIFSYANIGGGRRLLGYYKRGHHLEKFGNHCFNVTSTHDKASLIAYLWMQCGLLQQVVHNFCVNQPILW